MLAAPVLLLLVTAADIAPAVAIPGDGPPGTEEYFWPKRGGTYIGHGAVPFNDLVDFKKEAAWTWDNPDDELFRHGPVIDGKKNVYVATAIGRVQKFSPDGEPLWTWRTTWHEGRVVTSPFLYKGRLYINSMGPDWGKSSMAHCLDMETGQRLWVAPVKAHGQAWFDSHTVHLAEDVLLGALTNYSKPWGIEGHNAVYAMNATDGSPLWEFTLDTGNVWNFMPVTPGDGTFYFATTCGRPERRSLVDGSKIWVSNAVKDVADNICSTAGATLGPNGVLYAETTNPLVSPGDLPLLGPDHQCGDPTRCHGLLIAYNASDGEALWARWLQEPFTGMQFPAVGKIGGRLVVVAGIGENPMLARAGWGEDWYPQLIQVGIARLLYNSEAFRRIAGVPIKRNAVAAFDAQTGEQLWLWEEPPWDFLAAKGDEGPIQERFQRANADHRVDAICGPDNWGIPAILADGTVVAGSGSTGMLHAIRDANGDGIIQDSEVSTREFEAGFLNGPAFAPGMMAVAPCWGKMYVFKNDAR